MKNQVSNLFNCESFKLPLREFLAEFLGMFILISFGAGSVAQSVLTGSKINDFFAIVWGYSLGVFLGMTVSVGGSGGHLNPAYSVAMSVWQKLSWRKLLVYVAAQYLGAFVASTMIFVVYHDALTAFESVPSKDTARIWASYPGWVENENGTIVSTHLSATNGAVDQIFGSMMQCICICAINDQKNMNIPPWIRSFFTALSVVNIGLSFGFNCGFPLNPARDLAPRLFTAVAGWGFTPFSIRTSDGIPWWWIPVVGPHIGYILGMFVYTSFIEMHCNTENTSTQTKCVNTGPLDDKDWFLFKKNNNNNNKINAITKVEN